MAQRSKSKKNQSSGPASLKSEKEAKLTVSQVIRDERTHKITGAVFLLISIFLFIAFTSYLFTWREDQSLVRSISVFSPAQNDKVANLLGSLGAHVSYFFFFNGFGVASYFICSFFFITGVNWLFAKKVFSIRRNLRYVIIGLVFLSTALAFIAGGVSFPWGGAVGNMIRDWMVRFLGRIGTACVLFAAALSYFIWRFNPEFKVPDLTKKDKSPALIPVEEKQDDGPLLFVEEPVTKNKKNRLSKEADIPLIFPVDEQLPAHAPYIQEEQKPPPVLPLSPIKLPKKEPVNPLELEIKAVPEPDPEELIPAEPGTKAEKLPDYEPTLDLRSYKYPTLDLLAAHGNDRIIQDPAELETNKNQIISTLKNYDIDIQKISATVGPTVTLYEIVPSPGVRISRIKNLEDDIALSLAALGIRIIAPIPGKGTIGIEVPNVKKTVVSMRTLLASEKFQHNSFNLPIAIGKKIDNENFIVDLSTMPHLLMAGATGQGKSVGLNAILVSLLYKKHPSQLKLVLVDPKKVELSLYRVIEKHFLAKLPGEEEPIITDTKKVVYTLNALCIEMDNRYDLLKEAGTRNIREYNDKFIKRKLNPQKGHQYLPFIVLVIDEFADLIMTAGKEIEMPIARLAQLARAVGIHLIIATQRPSVNIITGTIKANFPARIAFKVSSKIDSRTILDTGGAEQLIGKGDMLVSYNGEITRLQCAFVDTPEVEEIAEFIGRQAGYPQAFLLPEYVDERDMDSKDFDVNNRDPLFEEAARLIVQNQVGSTSLLQRRMKLGYNRAGRLMDQLEAAGVVGPNQGSKAREVIIKTELELTHYLDGISG
ncbi:MAG: DNA translocase FtsK 4TM domain-containing protein [Bacteroidota bacterium]|nr:DNA translocase FtsK 4TM domain-containing protein [Bacteroidota bacterium]